MRRFPVLAAVVVVIEDQRWRDGRIVVETIGEEVFLLTKLGGLRS